MSQIHKKSLANNVLRIFLIQQHLKEGISIKKTIYLLIKLHPKSNDSENWQKRTLCSAYILSYIRIQLREHSYFRNDNNCNNNLISHKTCM